MSVLHLVDGQSGSCPAIDSGALGVRVVVIPAPQATPTVNNERSLVPRPRMLLLSPSLVRLSPNPEPPSELSPTAPRLFQATCAAGGRNLKTCQDFFRALHRTQRRIDRRKWSQPGSTGCKAGLRRGVLRRRGAEAARCAPILPRTRARAPTTPCMAGEGMNASLAPASPRATPATIAVLTILLCCVPEAALHMSGHHPFVPEVITPCSCPQVHTAWTPMADACSCRGEYAASRPQVASRRHSSHTPGLSPAE